MNSGMNFSHSKQKQKDAAGFFNQKHLYNPGEFGYHNKEIRPDSLTDICTEPQFFCTVPIWFIYKVYPV